MPSAQHTVTIQRPVGEVFAFVADGLNGPQWRSGVLDIAHVSGEGVGAVYRQGAKGPGGRRIAADYVITAYEPDRHLAFRVTAGPVRPTGEYRFETTGQSTTLTFSLAAELSGIQKLLLGRAVQRTMEAEVQATENLQSILESRS